MNRVLAIALIATFLCGCKDHKPVPPPKTKINAAAKEHYRVVLTIIDDPGVPIQVVARGGYAIVNLGCIPIDYTRSIGGSKPQFAEHIELPVTQVADKVYVTRIAADYYLDEDYYGLGTCRWEPMASFRMQRGSVSLGVAMTLEEMSREETEVVLCPTYPLPVNFFGCTKGLPADVAYRDKHFRVQVQIHKE